MSEFKLIKEYPIWIEENNKNNRLSTAKFRLIDDNKYTVMFDNMREYYFDKDFLTNVYEKVKSDPKGERLNLNIGVGVYVNNGDLIEVTEDILTYFEVNGIVVKDAYL